MYPTSMNLYRSRIASLEGSPHRAPSPYAMSAHPRNPRLPSSFLFSYDCALSFTLSVVDGCATETHLTSSLSIICAQLSSPRRGGVWSFLRRSESITLTPPRTARKKGTYSAWKLSIINRRLDVRRAMPVQTGRGNGLRENNADRNEDRARARSKRHGHVRGLLCSGIYWGPSVRLVPAERYQRECLKV